MAADGEDEFATGEGERCERGFEKGLKGLGFEGLPGGLWQYGYAVDGFAVRKWFRLRRPFAEADWDGAKLCTGKMLGEGLMERMEGYLPRDRSLAHDRQNCSQPTLYLRVARRS